MPGCFSRLSSKFSNKNENNVQDGPDDNKPNDQSTVHSGQAASGQLDGGAPSKEPEKESPKEEKKDEKKNRWLQAFEQLSESKQEALKKMGFGNPNSDIESSLAEVTNSVEEKQKECEGKFWKAKIGGKEIVFREYTEQIVGWVEKAGDIAINFAPPQAGLPWDLVKSLMKIPVNESEQMGALLLTTEVVVSITSRGQVYEDIYLNQPDDVPLSSVQRHLEKSLIELYKTSLDLLARSNKLLSSNTWGRIFEAIVNPGKAADGVAGLGTQEDALLRDIHACEAKRSATADKRANEMLNALQAPMARVDAGVSHLLNRVNEGERIKLLEWISDIPFGQHHDRIREKRTSGTGEWLVEHEVFNSWKDKESSDLFWLQGNSGSGKTYLTSKVIDTVRDRISYPLKPEGFAFFYCDRDDKPCDKALTVLQSFVRQLSTTARNPESMQTKLQETCKEARENGTNFRFQQCKEQILTSLDIYQKTTLVIDAMDECDPESRYELIDALTLFLRESKKPVKIFISSRPDPKLERQLESSPNVGIQASDNKGDIEKYIKVSLKRLAQANPFLRRLRPKIVEKLLERSQGMFQWVSLQLQQIGGCDTPSAVWTCLNNLPEDLESAYDRVWLLIEARAEPDKSLAKRALRWAMAASKPLTSAEILGAIRLDVNGTMFPIDEMVDEQGLLSLCNSFLSIDSQLQVWRFPHLSVREYLEKKEDWSVSRAHYHAASVCLSYFVKKYGTDSHELDAQLEDEWKAEMKAELEAILEEAREKEREEEQEKKEENDDVEDDEDDVDGEEDEDDESDTIEIPDEWLHQGPEMPCESDDGFHTLHPFHIYMRHSWAHHVNGAKDIETAQLGSLLKTFLGSPNAGSVEYRRWHEKTFNDFEEFFFGPSLKAYMTNDARNIFLETKPGDAPIFAMCRFPLSTAVWDWWENAEIDISRLNENGHNQLAIAALVGCLPICKKLVDRGVDVNTRLKGKWNGSALVAATSDGQTDVVKYLVESGADVNVKLSLEEGQYDCALEAAIKRGAVDTVRYLVREAHADIDISLQRSWIGHLLGEAAVLPSVEILTILLDGGADVNTLFTGQRFGSALGAACSGQFENVKLLVKRGADVNLQLPNGGYGCALLQACVSDRDLVIPRYLVNEAGADANLSLENGEFGSVLAGATCDEFADLDVVKFLVKSGADINKSIEHGKYGSVLAAAAAASEYADLDIFRWLLKEGANVNLPLKHGQFGSALAAAVRAGIHDRIHALIEAGADLNMVLEGRDFGSAFALAAAFEYNFQVPQVLVGAGANVNLKTPGRYGTPLIAAACFGQKDCVEYLVKNGADVNLAVENSPYPTALQAAKSDISEHLPWMHQRYDNPDDVESFAEDWAEEKPDIVEFLQSKGAKA
ncbi:hypothetical protein NUU61_002351 [Penicillium alfredii]|uniref:NACHT domain-containing protein n=1 Tax=Penicillium alfredii TaxID=1506179 RepID=A0A9W9FRJ7_9EURO|nr:uncharacterized protein NUU61_002351 [Penicillium alfredii]KAJ5105004.1 hypothetical protein NUU61_002351 [Penicillium alfredii]